MSSNAEALSATTALSAKTTSAALMKAFRPAGRSRVQTASHSSKTGVPLSLARLYTPGFAFSIALVEEVCQNRPSINKR